MIIFRMEVAIFVILALVIFLLLTDKASMIESLLLKSIDLVFGEQSKMTHSWIQWMRDYPNVFSSAISFVGSSFVACLPVSNSRFVDCGVSI